jgi:chorismate mutase
MKKASDIKNLRRDIDRIHRSIFELLLQRAKVTEKIWSIKKNAKIKMTDAQREIEVIHQFDQHPKLKKNPALKKMIQEIQKNIIKKNKTYLKDKNAKI